MAKPPSKIEKSPPTDLLDTQSADLEELIAQKIGDVVSQKQRDVIVARMASLVVSEHFSGPIAHPRHLKAYEEIEPGAAGRIIRMAEKQQDHHITMDTSILDAEKADRKLGMWLGFAAFCGLIAAALVVALLTTNSVLTGLFLGAATLGAVGLFVRGRQNGK